MHPNVDDVCVVGVPDLYSGEVPVAFVVLSVEAAGRIAADHAELQKTKLSILQVKFDPFFFLHGMMLTF
jgi:acyl-coenzyme A synthetase/AMP-(fatty) acid ligase